MYCASGLKQGGENGGYTYVNIYVMYGMDIDPILGKFKNNRLQYIDNIALKHAYIYIR